MDHHHHHHHEENKRVLWVSFLLIVFFMILEAFGGFISHSLTLLSDAGHMLSDAISLGLSLLAIIIGSRKATEAKTYGYKRFEILVALFNGVSLLVISILIIIEACQRFIHPESVKSMTMLWIAITGAVVNVLVAYILLKGDTSGNLNIRSALVHVIGDLLGSLGAIMAAIIIYFTGWGFVDALASILVSLLIVKSAWFVIREATNILMEGTPDYIDLKKLRNELESIDGVCGLHDLHIWMISNEFPSFSCHIIAKSEADRDSILTKANHILSHHFSVDHTTIQIESETYHQCCNETKHDSIG
ncbi:cation diffusion facilitator family transporter [Terrilactibacillus sp. BCM23-1]|uniref:Cation diffusion facilitator family transporter n=1 Tax=Terrilactibacillus tamarindi TaxID=2599694 RepID=A0A6N8CMC6_9BACI|nr:cation diffusion facilitator family transporter [Terrilactibacillus tamarindi]MTT31204.1 cation diffusion facilitator family transporter [Terrilactibacillus tamarindi]